MVCLYCGEPLEESAAGTVKCAQSKCKSVAHAECVAQLRSSAGKSGTKHTCALHFCAVCHGADPKSKQRAQRLLRCVHCFRCFHKNCAGDSTRVTYTADGKLACSLHPVLFSYQRSRESAVFKVEGLSLKIPKGFENFARCRFYKQVTNEKENHGELQDEQARNEDIANEVLQLVQDEVEGERKSRQKSLRKAVKKSAEGSDSNKRKKRLQDDADSEFESLEQTIEPGFERRNSRRRSSTANYNEDDFEFEKTLTEFNNSFYEEGKLAKEMKKRSRKVNLQGFEGELPTTQQTEFREASNCAELEGIPSKEKKKKRARKEKPASSERETPQLTEFVAQSASFEKSRKRKRTTEVAEVIGFQMPRRGTESQKRSSTSHEVNDAVVLKERKPKRPRKASDEGNVFKVKAFGTVIKVSSAFSERKMSSIEFARSPSLLTLPKSAFPEEFIAEQNSCCEVLGNGHRAFSQFHFDELKSQEIQVESSMGDAFVDASDVIASLAVGKRNGKEKKVRLGSRFSRHQVSLARLFESFSVFYIDGLFSNLSLQRALSAPSFVNSDQRSRLQDFLSVYRTRTFTVSKDNESEIDRRIPYTPICENLYSDSVWNEIESERELQREDHICDCSPLDYCDVETCSNRQVYIECSPETCPCKERCTNQNFARSNYANLKIVDCGSRGYGIVCLHDLNPGEFVIEYCGEIIDRKEYEFRKRELVLKGISYYYFFSLAANRIIDAGPFGNLARFINHSCAPNCRAEKWLVDDEPRVGIFASQFIPAGQELTYNYNFSGLDQSHECFCGADSCTGYISNDFGKHLL